MRGEKDWKKIRKLGFLSTIQHLSAEISVIPILYSSLPRWTEILKIFCRYQYIGQISVQYWPIPAHIDRYESISADFLNHALKTRRLAADLPFFTQTHEPKFSKF